MPPKKAKPPAPPKPEPAAPPAPVASDNLLLSREQIAEMLGISILSQEQIAGAAPVPTAAKPPLLDSIMSPEQLAEGLGVSTATLLRWHHRQVGPPRVKIPGTRKIYYHRSDVETYMRSAVARRSRA